MNSFYVLVLALFLFASSRKFCQASVAASAESMQADLNSMPFDEIKASFGNEAKFLEEQERIVQTIQARQSNFVMKLKDLSAQSLSKEDVAVLSRSILEEFEAFKSKSTKS